MVTETAKITASKIFSQPFWNIYNLLNDRSNVPDPNDKTGARKFVYRRQPNFGRNFAGFPFIIVRGTKPTSGPGSANKSKIFKDYDNMVEVYAQDTDSDTTGNPAGAETRDQIADNIVNTLDNQTNRKTLRNNGQGHIVYEVDIDDEAELDGKTLFAAMFDLRSERNLLSTS